MSLHVLVAAELLTVFWHTYPHDLCVTSGGYVANQVQNGLALGLVYATMAVGLTLIFSVQNIVNFAHGQLFMAGGVFAYFLNTHLSNLNPLFMLPIVGLILFAVGVLFEKLFLAPIHEGRVERPDEHALLVTFGFGLFLAYAMLGVLGSARGIKSPRYTDRPLFGLDRPIIEIGSVRIRTDFWIAGLLGLLMILLLTIFLKRTWTGKSLQAVAMDAEAASMVGINSGRTFTLGFGIGAMLAGMAGAALVPALSFPVPQMAGEAGVRSYVIIVLGGLGSIPGALVGGLFVGTAEAIGSGCFPDAARAAAYQPAFPLILFAVFLLLRPRGFFGRVA